MGASLTHASALDALAVEWRRPLFAARTPPRRRGVRGILATQSIEKLQGLDRSTLIAIYRNIYLSRRIDDKEIQLKRQNKIYFQISSAGHEAVSTAAGMVCRPGYDWFDLYYRDRALCLQIGVTPYEMFLQAVGAREDPASAGRQMPAHWGSKRINLI